MGTMAPMENGNPQAGGALLYVITIATVLTALFAISVYQSRAGSNKIAGEKWRGQSSLVSQSGIAYLQNRLSREIMDSSKYGGGLGRITLHHALDSAGMGFDISARSLGLLIHVRSTGRSGHPLENLPARSDALLAAGINLSELPAIALTDKNAGIVLGEMSGIGGPAMVWRGGVHKSTDSHIRWKGGVGHAGPVWDSASDKWNDLKIDSRTIDSWFDRREAWVRGTGSLPENTGEDGATVAEERDSIHLSDTLMVSRRLVSKGIVHLDRGARLEGCDVSGSLVIIEPGVHLRNTILSSTGKIVALGPKIFGGQLFAVDSIRLSEGTELFGCPLILVKGRRMVVNKTDTILFGKLDLAEAKGMGVFISVPEKGEITANNPSLAVGKNAQVSGFFYTGGLADIKSDIQGSVFCHNLVSVDKGNLWMGCLRDARIEQDVSGAFLPGPLIFPAFPILPFPIFADAPDAEAS